MIVKEAEQEGYEKLSQELRRGVVILAALSQLQTPQYGYSLIDRLAERGFSIDQGTLYPLLRRLESQGLLDSMWNVEGSRPRRYYVINEAGRGMLEQLRHDWQSLGEVMQRLLHDEGVSDGTN